MFSFKRVFHILLQLCSPWLLGLLFYPFFIGLLVSVVPMWMDMLVSIMWVPVVLLPYFLLQYRLLYVSAVLIIGVCGGLNLIHLLLCQVPVSAINLMALLNTNLSESVEFIQATVSVKLLYFPLYIFFLYRSLRSTNDIGKRSAAVILLTFFPFFLFGGYRWWQGMFAELAVPLPYRAVSVCLAEQYRNSAVDNYWVASPLNVEIGKKNPDIIFLIIGESQNRGHMSLYGADVCTNPRLEERDDIIIYTDVISEYSHTLKSVVGMLTNMEQHEPVEKDSVFGILDVFHSAGYRTYWLSNQCPFGIWDGAIGRIAKKADETVFVNEGCTSSPDAARMPSYDELLLAPLQEVLHDTASKKMIILHLMGCHMYYRYRYPSVYSKFSGTGDAEQKTIAEYHNAMLYNDFICDSIIEMFDSFAELEQLSVAGIITADHGESVYDIPGIVGHHSSAGIYPCLYEIPFIMYRSDEYERMFPQKIKSLTSNKHKPMQLPMVFDLMQGMAAIYSPQYDSLVDASRKSFVGPVARGIYPVGSYENLLSR